MEIDENTKSTQCILDMQTKATQTPKTFFKDKAVLKKKVMQRKGEYSMYKKYIKMQMFNVILTVAQVKMPQ